MTTPDDTRTEAEQRYDAERDGSLYLPTDTLADLPEDIKAWIDSHRNTPPVTFQMTRFSDGSGEPWPEYHCGGSSLTLDGPIMLYCAATEVGPLSCADLHELRALLNDERVVALMEARR